MVVFAVADGVAANFDKNFIHFLLPFKEREQVGAGYSGRRMEKNKTFSATFSL